MQGKREFNIEQKWGFLAKADYGKNQADHFYKNISGWTDQYKKYASSGLTGSVKNYFGELESTLNKGKQDINKIYEAAEEVENDYAEKCGNVAFEMELYTDRINALLSVLHRGPVLNAFVAPDFAARLEKAKKELLEKEILALIANPDKLENLDIANRDVTAYISLISDKYRGQDLFGPPPIISNVERDLLIKCFEHQYPEKEKIMTAFLKPISKGGDHDNEVQCIKYLAYSSPEPYNNVFFKYLPKVNISEHHQSGTQYFSVGIFGGKNIYIDIGRVIYLDSSGNPAPTDPANKGGYATFFHEIGHAIDRLMGLPSPALDDAITIDVKNALRADIESRYLPPLSSQDQADIDAILDSLMAKAPLLQSTGDAARDAFANQVRTDTINHFENVVLKGGSNSTASDVYGGVTDNKIHGTWAHYPDSKGKSYWVEKGHKPSSEFFADAFSYHMTGYADSLKSIEDNLPKARKAFVDMIDAGQ